MARLLRQSRSANSMEQLPLGIRLRDASRFDSFLLSEANREAASALRLALASSDWFAFFLHGPEESGRSHLLEASCQQCASQGRQAMYLPLAELKQAGPSLLDGLEAMDLLCLDDLDAVSNDPEWAESLFHLHNRSAEHSCSILYCANASPRTLGVALPDLRSRLQSALNYRISPLDDSAKLECLRLRCELAGLELSEDVAKYLMTRAERSLSALVGAIDALDKRSLVEQRRLTIPFVKATLGL